MAKKPIELEIIDFFTLWNGDTMVKFMDDIVPLIEMLQEDNEIVEPLSEEDKVTTNIRLIRYVYLMSYLAETYAGKLVRIRAEHKDLWRRLEKIAEEEQD